MTYESTLQQISQAIFDLSGENQQHLSTFLNESSLKNVSIYQRNLMGNLIRSLSEDFPTTKKYLGESNFNYFLRQYLLENKIDTPVIFDISKTFPAFLEKHYETHQDDLVEYIAKLDLLWLRDHTVNIEVPSGMTTYWNRLGADEDCHDITLSFEQYERVELIIKGEEKNLVVTKL